MAQAEYGERTQWNHRYSEFKSGSLVRQQNGVWRLTRSRVCGGNTCGPHNGVAHDHRDTATMTEQDAVNLLIDWGYDLADAKGLENYR